MSRFSSFRVRALGLILFLLGTGWAQAAASESTKPQVLIITDMTHDDGNSLIRYLYYSHMFDTLGIVVTPQLPDYDYDSQGPWQKAQQILSAYGEEFTQLRQHHADYPEPKALQRVTKQGRGALPIIWLTNEKEFSGPIGDRKVTSSWGKIEFSDWIGDGVNPHGHTKDSEGSEFLLELFRRPSDAPLFVQMWGGPITFVQALFRYRQEASPADFQRLLDRLHIYGILFQDITFDFMVDLDLVRTLSCGNLGTVESTYHGDRVAPRWLLYDAGHFWRYCCPLDRSLKPMHAHEVRGHGPLSELYDDGGEGDTPAFLYLVSAQLGLNDPLDPTQGSWGSRFASMGADFPPGYYHTCDLPMSELTRWIPAVKRSFLNRLSYSTRSPAQVNREPAPVVQGKPGPDVIRMTVDPGERVLLDASESYDQDGDDLAFDWWVYPEASSYPGRVEFEPAQTPQFVFTVPTDIGEHTVHLILEVRDNGSPSLVAYRRVILRGNGQLYAEHRRD